MTDSSASPSIDTSATPWFETLASLASVGVLMISPSRDVEFASVRARDLLGCDGAASLDDCTTTIRDKLTQMMDHVDQAQGVDTQSSDQSTCVEDQACVAIGPHQRPRNLNIELYPIEVSDCHGYLCVLRDQRDADLLTEDLQLASQFRNMGRHYQAVAHDMRAPIGSARLYLNVLRQLSRNESRPAADCDERRMQALGALDQIVNLIDESLTTLLDDVTATEATTTTFDLNNEILDLLKWIEPQAQLQKVALEISLSPQTVTVRGSRHRLKHGILNILNNALEALPNGGTIGLRMAVEQQFATIAISDDGVGIPRSVQSKVFDQHFTTKPTGHGLGLQNARDAVERMGGTIGFESEPGRGTTFRLMLPRVDDGDVAPHAGA